MAKFPFSLSDSLSIKHPYSSNYKPHLSRVHHTIHRYKVPLTHCLTVTSARLCSYVRETVAPWVSCKEIAEVLFTQLLLYFSFSWSDINHEYDLNGFKYNRGNKWANLSRRYELIWSALVLNMRLSIELSSSRWHSLCINDKEHRRCHLVDLFVST